MTPPGHLAFVLDEEPSCERAPPITGSPSPLGNIGSFALSPSRSGCRSFLVVFAAFTTGDFLMLKMLGFSLAIAVLVDATVVRIVIGPALLQLAGRWNWWPGEPIRASARPGPDPSR